MTVDIAAILDIAAALSQEGHPNSAKHLRDMVAENQRLSASSVGVNVGVAEAPKKALRERLRAILDMCDSDVRDQEHNATTTTDARLRAYAEGRRSACRSIANHLRIELAAGGETHEN